MTYDEAIEFFSNYGGVSKNILDLKIVKPTLASLDAAAYSARYNKEQSEQKVEEAKEAILSHYESLNSPVI